MDENEDTWSGGGDRFLLCFLFFALREAGAGHALAKTAVFEEGRFELTELLVEEVIGLVYNTNHYVCDDLWRTCLYIGPIGLIGRMFVRSEFPHIRRFTAGFVPKREFTRAQEISVVFEKLFQTCTGYIEQLYFGLFRRSRNLRSLDNILFTRSRRVHHLVACSIALVQKTLAKPNGPQINDLRLLV